MIVASIKANSRARDRRFTILNGRTVSMFEMDLV